MSFASTVRLLKSKSIPTLVMVAASLAVLGGMAFAAQDRYTVQVPDGLAFSEFKGYEDWQTVAVSQTEDAIAVILANPVMIDAYRSGVPGNGKPFPDGSKTAKIHWKPTIKCGGARSDDGARCPERRRLHGEG